MASHTSTKTKHTEPKLPTLISDPEPAWLTPDIKQRFLRFNHSESAARQAAQQTHEWRLKIDADTALQRPCPWYLLVNAVFPTYTLIDENSEGHAVIYVKAGRVRDLCNLVLRPPNGSTTVTMDQMEHVMTLFNEYVTQVAAPKPLPAGCQVQIYDMAGFELSHVGLDMITLFKLLVRMIGYYPDRLHAAIVINAPGWFSYPWKLMSALLDEKTNSRVVVVSSPVDALPVLMRHMGGIDNVPVVWGGKSTTLLDAYPAHQRMMQFAQKLNDEQQPLEELQLRHVIKLQQQQQSEQLLLQ